MKPFFPKILSRTEIDRLVDERVRWILEVCTACRIIVFGSAGRYDMTEGSDLDLIVVVPEAHDAKAIYKAIVARKPPNEIPLDLLVYHESDYAQRSAVGGACFLAASEGRVAYPAEAATTQEPA